VFGACWLLACIEGISALDLAGRLVAALHTGTGLRAVRAGTATEIEAERGTEETSSNGDGDGDEQHGEIRRHNQVAGAGCDSLLLRARGQGIWAFTSTIDYYHIINTKGPCLMFDSSPNIPRRPVPASTLAVVVRADSCAT
jgi:hypothetical protein